MRRFAMLVGILLLVPLPAAAGGGGGAICSGFAEGTAISMWDSCFEGIAHFAPAGATLTVTNQGELPHTFTAVDGSFDSGTLESGQTFDVTVDSPAILRVYCTLHGTAAGEGMAGVLIVGEPTPESVAALGDVEQIVQTVTEENGVLMAAIERQAEELNKLRETQAGLAATLEGVAARPQQETATTPDVIRVPVEGSSGPSWLPALAGAAAGIAFAALLVAGLAVTRHRNREEGGDPVVAGS